MDLRTETQYRQEISVVWGMIGQLKAENAALEEQVNALDGKAVILRATIKAQEHWQDQAAQQAAVIEQMREAFRVASMDTETINRKAPEIAKGCCSMPMPDTEGTYHLANEEVCNVVSSYLYWLHKNQPTALQPSPEILDEIENRVADKIINWLRRNASAEANPAKKAAFAEAANAALSIKESK